MQIFREAGDLELRQDNWICRVGKIGTEERIDLAVGHKIGDITVEACGVYPLTRGEIFDFARHAHVRSEDVQVVAGAVFGAFSAGCRVNLHIKLIDRGDEPEISAVFIH